MTVLAEGQRELDDAQVGAQVATVAGHRFDDERADLDSQRFELIWRQGPQVGR